MRVVLGLMLFMEFELLEIFRFTYSLFVFFPLR